MSVLTHQLARSQPAVHNRVSKSSPSQRRRACGCEEGLQREGSPYFSHFCRQCRTYCSEMCRSFFANCVTIQLGLRRSRNRCWSTFHAHAGSFISHASGPAPRFYSRPDGAAASAPVLYSGAHAAHDDQSAGREANRYNAILFIKYGTAWSGTQTAHCTCTIQLLSRSTSIATRTTSTSSSSYY